MYWLFWRNIFYTKIVRTGCYWLWDRLVGSSLVLAVSTSTLQQQPPSVVSPYPLIAGLCMWFIVWLLWHPVMQSG